MTIPPVCRVAPVNGWLAHMTHCTAPSPRNAPLSRLDLVSFYTCISRINFFANETLEINFLREYLLLCPQIPFLCENYGISALGISIFD